MISRLRAATGGGDYAYDSGIVHFMAGLPPKAASAAWWTNGEPAARQRWRALVTVRQAGVRTGR